MNGKGLKGSKVH